MLRQGLLRVNLKRPRRFFLVVVTTAFRSVLAIIAKSFAIGCRRSYFTESL